MPTPSPWGLITQFEQSSHPGRTGACCGAQRRRDAACFDGEVAVRAATPWSICRRMAPPNMPPNSAPKIDSRMRLIRVNSGTRSRARRGSVGFASPLDTLPGVCKFGADAGRARGFAPQPAGAGKWPPIAKTLHDFNCFTGACQISHLFAAGRFDRTFFVSGTRCRERFRRSGISVMSRPPSPSPRAWPANTRRNRKLCRLRLIVFAEPACPSAKWRVATGRHASRCRGRWRFRDGGQILR